MTTGLRRGRGTTAAAVLGAVALLTACSASAAPSGSGGSGGEQLDVLTSFYPLQYLAERVGGEHAVVSTLAPAGSDSHDLDLTPAQVAEVSAADVVLHLSGLQPATDEAVDLRGPHGVLDAAGAADLGPTTGEARDEEGVVDPHFWLDPTRFAAVGRAVAEELSAADPDHAADYAAAADLLADDLAALDAQLVEGLAGCRGATLVTAHEAFGYLAQRYGLQQVGIAGIDPDVEPSPSRLRDVVAVVQGRDVETIFFEVATSTGVAQVLAEDLGVSTAVLDPLERMPVDGDYLTTMRANLAALGEGLACPPAAAGG